MGSVAPYVFTWGSSHWGNADSDWSTPGPVAVAATTANAVSTVGPVVPVLLVHLTVAPAIMAFSDVSVTSTDAVYVAPDNTGIYVSQTTARLYDRLPAVYRDDDATIGTGPTGNYPLLRYMSCLVDQAGDVEATLDSFIPPTSSALTDPMAASPAWLPWLGQLVGIRVNPAGTQAEAQARLAISTALTCAPRGSRQSIINVVMPVLSGTQSVTVTDHYQGDPWKIQVATIGTETPPNLTGSTFFVWGTSTWGVSTEWNEPDPIVQLLDTADVKPAGFQIVHTRS